MGNAAAAADLSEGCTRRAWPVLGHQFAREVLIFPLHHTGNAEQIDQHPEAETANRQPVEQLNADAAEVEVVEAEEEPEEVGEERGFFADFIVVQHQRLRVGGKGLKNSLQGIWNGHGFSFESGRFIELEISLLHNIASESTRSLGDEFLLGV